MITTILFDVGNVLLTFDPLPYYQEIFPKETFEPLMQLFFGGRVWHEYDQGHYSEEELIAYFKTRAPELEKEIDYFFNTYFDLLTPIQPVIEFALEIKKTKRISILSNMPEKSEYYILDQFKFLNEFETPLYSWREKLIKPDSAIYKLQLERLNVKPEEVLFIDDKLENIEAAQALGIHAIQMTNPESTLPLIKQFLMI